MKAEMFEELLGSVREAGAFLRSHRKKPSQKNDIVLSAVRVILERTSLSQFGFADLISGSVKTLQNGDKDRKRLLKSTVDSQPE